MDFRLTEADEDILSLAKEVGEKVVAPWAERAEAGEHPVEAYEGLANAGLTGMVVPEEYDGPGCTYLQLSLVMETLGQYSPAIAEHLNMSNCNLILPILKFGTEEQKRKWLPRIANGDAYCAFALTEPNAGSDNSAMSTSAVRDGDDYILNGQKCFISGAEYANLIMLFAVTSPKDAPKKEITAFILERDENTTGYTVGSPEKTMGMNGADANDIFLDDLRIPAANILGKPGDGFKAAMCGLNPGRTDLSSEAIGVAQRAIDLTVEYAKTRKMFGKTLAAFQNTQFVLAECQTQIDAARLLVRNACVMLDQGQDAAMLCSEAKWFATETANQVVYRCMQLWGGYGYSKEYPLEQMYRDLRIFTIFEGATEVQKHTIARFMGLR